MIGVFTGMFVPVMAAARLREYLVVILVGMVFVCFGLFSFLFLLFFVVFFLFQMGEGGAGVCNRCFGTKPGKFPPLVLINGVVSDYLAEVAFSAAGFLVGEGRAG